MARAYVPLYFSYAEQLAMLPDDERGRLILALLEYAQTGALPAFAPASAMAMLFSCMRAQLDRDVANYTDRCEKNRKNALAGWDKRNAIVCENVRSHTMADKAKAQKAFSKLCPNEQLLAEILAALDWQKQSPDWLKNGGQFVPYASSYLNGRRWEDEPPQNDAPARSDTPKLRWSTNENGEREAVYDE